MTIDARTLCRVAVGAVLLLGSVVYGSALYMKRSHPVVQFAVDAVIGLDEVVQVIGTFERLGVVRFNFRQRTSNRGWLFEVSLPLVGSKGTMLTWARVSEDSVIQSGCPRYRILAVKRTDGGGDERLIKRSRERVCPAST